MFSMKTQDDYLALTIALILILFTATGCNKPVRVLSIAGGHAYDTSEFYQALHSLEGLAIDTITHPRAKQVLASGKVDSYDVLVFYDFIPGMPLEDSAIYLELIRRGVPMLFLHHSFCSFQEWEGFREIVGGKYVMPDSETDSSLHSRFKHDIVLEVEVVDPLHPVNAGISDFTIHDEGYSNILINEGIHPLLSTRHPDCAPLVGWVNQAGNSTCVYLMMGHDKHAYGNESFQLLVQNAIHWLKDQ